MGAWIGPVLTGVSALAGLFGGSKQKQNATVDKTVMPSYDPQQQAFRDYLISAFRGNLENDQGFGAGYKTSGLQSIADASNTAGNSVASILAARGLGRTTAGAFATGDRNYRAGSQISNFLQNLPLVLDQRRQNLLQGAGSFFSSLPAGTHTTGYDNTSITGGPTSPVAGLVGGASQGIASWLGALNAQNILKNLGIGAPKTPSAGNSDYWG